MKLSCLPKLAAIHLFAPALTHSHQLSCILSHWDKRLRMGSSPLQKSQGEQPKKIQ
jgi:hypothetical protein